MTLRAEETLPPSALAAVRAPFEALGGAWVDAPVLQPLSALLDLAGESMRARLFVVQGDGGEAIALRPDFTIPVAQSHIASGAAGGRYLYAGKVFRTAPAGSDRPVEFLQIGTERFGAPENPALEDAEAVALAWAAAKAGGRDDLSILLGDAGLFAGFVRALGVPEAVAARLIRAFTSGRPLTAELARAQAPTPASAAGGGRLAALLADLPETEAAGVLEELWRLAGIQPVGGRSAEEIVHRLAARSEAGRTPPLSAVEADLIGRYLRISGTPHEALKAVEHLAYEAKVAFDLQLQPWVRRLKALDAAGVPEAALTLSTGFVRAFGYYDGLLFEIRSAALGADKPVAAGGRYDALPVRLGGSTAGAVGCIVRPARAWNGAVQ
jgi:ATP phosphoribosyltransferase regulatory subunit